MTPLQLNLPAREESSGAAADLRPKALQAWIEHLPMAHAIEAGQQVLERLREINRTAAAPAVRYAAMELLHPPLQHITAILQKSHRDASFPLPAGHCLMTTLCQQLLEKMANGYKLVIMEQLLESDASMALETLLGTRVQPMLARSLWRAVDYLSAQLLESFLIYAPQPEGVWQDLHRLYQFSEQRLLHLAEVTTPSDETPSGSTLNAAYKRILLLAMCNPYHLLQGEALQLFQQLQLWSETVKIVRPGGTHPVAGVFIVDFDADAAPRYAPPSQPLAIPEHGRVVEVNEALARLDAHIQTLRAQIVDKQNRRVSALAERREYDLYARLKRSWEIRQDRRSVRSPQPSNVVMVTGLSASHHFVGDMADFAPEETEARLRDPSAAAAAGVLDLEDDATPPPVADATPGLVSGEENEGVDIWQQAYAIPATKPRHERAPPRDAPAFTINPWQQRNAGRGGMAVFCVSDCHAHVRVGELVAYKRRPVRAEDPWQLGVIRWLRAPDFVSVELGIMALEGPARAVAVRAMSGTGAGGAYARSLLLAPDGTSAGYDSLITPPTIYDEGTVLLVNLGDRLQRIKLIELVEATRAYARFRYTELELH